MRWYSITVLFIVAHLPLLSVAQKQGQALVDSLEQRLTTASEDTNRVLLLCGLSRELATLDGPRSQRYGNEALALARRLRWRKGEATALQTMGRNQWSRGAYTEAKRYHEDALAIWTDLGDDRKVGAVLTLLGQDHADAGEYAEALARFRTALGIFERLGIRTNVSYEHNLMAWVYDQMGMYTEAATHHYASLRMAEEDGNHAQVAIELSNLASAKVQQGQYAEAIKVYREAVPALEAINDQFNLAINYLDIGTCEAGLGQVKEAMVQFDRALAIAEKMNYPAIKGRAYQQIATIHARQGKDRDALQQLRSAEAAYIAGNNKSELAGVYILIGNCQTRLGDHAAAQASFDQASTLAEELKSLPMRSDYHQGVMRLDSATGRWRDAFEHLKAHVALHDSMFNEETTRGVERSRVQYTFEKKEAATRAEQEKKDALAQQELKRQKMMRNGFMGGFGLVALFAVIFFVQRNRVSKARKRSDELLLNILPEEVAEELKDTGAAQAKHFDSATILFTDFKGFTQASEKMSPQELVEELNTCFKAFDNIITARGIEKIKTIGDAYMCAGGLPDPKSSSPIDVVHAALVMQTFMKARRAERDAQGKPAFEMRVGIHTGPVVAGIVGVKKFQYDIWGDTVNTASRMESSGEVGQVNISEATYALVKNETGLTFTPRGKVQAKGKGEMEMYFVESA